MRIFSWSDLGSALLATAVFYWIKEYFETNGVPLPVLPFGLTAAVSMFCFAKALAALMHFVRVRRTRAFGPENRRYETHPASSNS